MIPRCSCCPIHSKRSRNISRLRSGPAPDWCREELKRIQAVKQTREQDSERRSKERIEFDLKFIDKVEIFMERGLGLSPARVKTAFERGGKEDPEFKRMIAAYGIERVRRAYLDARPTLDPRMLSAGERK